MNTKDENMIQDYDAILDERYGAEGTPQRAKFEENAYAYYSGQILKEARKKCQTKPN